MLFLNIFNNILEGLSQISKVLAVAVFFMFESSTSFALTAAYRIFQGVNSFLKNLNGFSLFEFQIMADFTLLVEKFGVTSSICHCTNAAELLFVIVFRGVHGLPIRMILTDSQPIYIGRSGLEPFGHEIRLNRLKGRLNGRAHVLLLPLCLPQFILLQIGRLRRNDTDMVAIAHFIHIEGGRQYQKELQNEQFISLPINFKMKIGIIGAGVSGLVLAGVISRNFIKKGIKAQVHIFQRNTYCGGRALSVQALNKKKQKLLLDIGANLIDFQNTKSQDIWKQILPQKFTKNLNPFSRSFLIYQNHKLRKGDYSKDRYYYAGGFLELIKDLQQEIDPQISHIHMNSQVSFIKIKDSKVLMQIKDTKKHNQQQYCFDKVFITFPSKQIANCFNNQDKIDQQTAQVKNFCLSVQYTKQISVAFATKPGLKHFFSSILFKHHPVLSFICSHQQKYNQDTYVAQIVQDFSEQYFNEEQKLVASKVYQSLPNEIKEITEPSHLLVHRWSNSLVKSIIRSEGLPDKHIILIGDSTTGKSRVSNAVVSSYVGFSKL